MLITMHGVQCPAMPPHWRLWPPGDPPVQVLKINCHIRDKTRGQSMPNQRDRIVQSSTVEWPGTTNHEDRCEPARDPHSAIVLLDV